MRRLRRIRPRCLGLPCLLNTNGISTSCLSDLALNALFYVLDALALVRLRRAEAPNLGRGLTQELLVDALEDENVLVDLRRDPVGERVVDRVRVAEREHDRLALDLGAVTDPVDLELALETLAHALYQVGRQRARKAMFGPRLARVVRPRHQELV